MTDREHRIAFLRAAAKGAPPEHQQRYADRIAGFEAMDDEEYTDLMNFLNEGALRIRRQHGNGGRRITHVSAWR